MNSIVTNLKDICRQKGLTLTDVANRMCTSPSNLLSSVKGNPTISKLQDIANALQVSISELLTHHPEKAIGITLIDGVHFQMSKPSANIVRLPIYTRYDILRKKIKNFVKSAINGTDIVSLMGMVETMEVFSLIYDGNMGVFYLSLCYADGRLYTRSYDKLEYCDWTEKNGEEIAVWNLVDITKELINDIEGVVPFQLLG